MNKKKYIQSAKRILGGKKRQDIAAQTELLSKHIRRIAVLVQQGWCFVDLVKAIVSIEPYIHLYHLRPDDDSLYIGFCKELRLYINHQRAYKRGELTELVENGRGEEATPPPPEGLSEQKQTEWRKQWIDETYRVLADSDPLDIVVVNMMGVPYIRVSEKGGEVRYDFPNPSINEPDKDTV